MTTKTGAFTVEIIRGLHLSQQLGFGLLKLYLLAWNDWDLQSRDQRLQRTPRILEICQSERGRSLQTNFRYIFAAVLSLPLHDVSKHQVDESFGAPEEMV
jgi:hypothetical protein